jgi:hypothetical protein
MVTAFHAIKYRWGGADICAQMVVKICASQTWFLPPKELFEKVGSASVWDG